MTMMMMIIIIILCAPLSGQCGNSGYINTQLYNSDAFTRRPCSVCISWFTETSNCHCIWRSHYPDMGFWHTPTGV